MACQLKWYNTYTGPEWDENKLRYRLHAACIEGDLPKVRRFYKGAALLQALDLEGRTPIMCALANGHLHILKFLLEQGGNINANNNDQKRTVLHFACEEGVVDIVKWLLENGANTNLRDKEDSLPIYLASQLEDPTKKFEIIKLLLEFGANPFVLCGFHGSPIVNAISQGDVAMVKLYIEHKLDIYKSLSPDWDYSPLRKVLENGQEDLVRYLIEIGVDFKDHEKIRFNCFTSVCESNNVNFIKFFWKTVYNEKLPETIKNTAIDEALWRCENPVFKFLLDIGCPIDSLNEKKATPLQTALSMYKIETAQFLLDNGADPNIKRADGKIALHAYCKRIKETEPLLTDLVTATRDINATDLIGQTPLHCAALAGSTDVLKYLIDRGADVRVVDINKRNVLHSLCRAEKLQWNLEVFKYLITAIGIESLDDQRRTPLHYAAENESKVIFDSLIEHGANINAISDIKGSVLHHALAAFRNYNATKLISMVPDINIVNRDDKTPLHYASLNKDIAEQLLEKGANIHATDNSGRTVLHYALNGRDVNHYWDEGEIYGTKAVDYLLKRGSDINAKDKFGRTPLHLAYKGGDLYVLKDLLLRGPDEKAVDYEGRNILHYAALGGYDTYELPFAVHLNVPDKNGHYPLFYSRSKEILIYLIERTEKIKADELLNYSFPLYLLEPNSLKMLIERGANINAVDENGNTLLHKIAEIGSPEVIKFLLERGVEINARNKELTTPLHLAAKKECSDTVKILVDHGADLKAEDKDKRTPLDYARNNENRIDKIVDYLMPKDI